MRSQLTKQGTGMNLAELKNYGETSFIKRYFKNVKAIATNLATLSLSNSTGELIKNCKKATGSCKLNYVSLRFTTLEIKGQYPKQ